jgi:hypothetical protein
MPKAKAAKAANAANNLSRVGITEAAEIGNVSAASIYYWAERGLIKSFKASKGEVKGKIGRPPAVVFDPKQVRAVAIELGHRRK